MRRLIVFLPLAFYVGWAAVHLQRAGRPFLLKWIDLSMALMFSLVAALVLKRLLLGAGEPRDTDDEDGRH